ncbi:MAG: SPASM domain-containing protein, partial [Oligoflexales bacterium]|nr:SPASM domain-containing protein [Oligoflexales bacterium]
GKTGVEYITLSGGEPLMRDDWPLIAETLSKSGVIPNMISNGWFFTDDIAQKAKQANISNIAISIDGLRDSHDYLRRIGSFDRALFALEIMKKYSLPSSVVTTINKRNLSQLDEMLVLFEKNGIYSWQLQIGSPMGNLTDHPDLVIEPSDIQTIIDFAHRQAGKTKVTIHLADCIGYYTQKESEIRAACYRCSSEVSIWQGCHAGIRSFGIRANGDIIGCTSIRDTGFIEGNIRQRSFTDIWNDPKSFSWNRDFSPSDLSGFCGRCQYGFLCRAGCSVTKMTTSHTIRENTYCVFRVEMEKIARSTPILSSDQMLSLARKYIEENDYQGAEVVLFKALERYPQEAELLELIGYVYFQMQKYELCRKANETVLRRYKDRCYALKGLGLALWKLGYPDEAVARLKRAVEVAPAGYDDPQHDLNIVLESLKGSGNK